MKALLHLLLTASLAVFLAATVAGCQSDPLGTNMSEADEAAFQQKVAQDPFPAAQSGSLSSN